MGKRIKQVDVLREIRRAQRALRRAERSILATERSEKRTREKAAERAELKSLAELARGQHESEA